MCASKGALQASPAQQRLAGLQCTFSCTVPFLSPGSNVLNKVAHVFSNKDELHARSWGVQAQGPVFTAYMAIFSAAACSSRAPRPCACAVNNRGEQNTKMSEVVITWCTMLRPYEQAMLYILLLLCACCMPGDPCTQGDHTVPSTVLLHASQRNCTRFVHQPKGIHTLSRTRGTVVHATSSSECNNMFH